MQYNFCMMRKALGILAAAAMLTGGQVLADDWLEKRDAEELYTYIDIQDCPISESEVTEKVQTMLFRSRIKPLTEWNSGDIVLYVVLDCTRETDATWLFNQTVMLAKIKREGRDNAVVSFRHDDQYHSFGKGGEALIVDTLDKAIDAAFVKYLNANFDLAPGD
jgi:hypothetical protein